MGLAGGINQYGFASSDPVNLDDPFGLCDRNVDPSCQNTIADDLKKALQQTLEKAIDKGVEIAGAVAHAVTSLAKEVAIQVGIGLLTGGEGNILRVGEGVVVGGRRLVAVARQGGRVLTESSHLRLANTARKDFSAISSTADEVVTAIARQSGWETATGVVRGSIRLGSGTVRYSIFNNPHSVGEWVVNAWIP